MNLKSQKVMGGASLFIWQIICFAVIGCIGFLIIRLLIISNFPRNKKSNILPPSLDLYPVVINWSSADRKYLAEVPDLPGCMADGATKAEALAASALAISQWMIFAHELGREIPAPRERLQIAA
ncbi:putative RNase H-like HicB family nuclease [Hymenobacter sp. UYAg731]